MTRAEDLADTTLSMLRGSDGRQAKEVERLAVWLANEERPDLLCLSNALLIGLAPRLKDAVRVPIVCELQDEDIFLDKLPEPKRQEAWAIIAERAGDVDAFLAPSRYFAEFMRQRLGLPEGRVHVVWNGLATEGYEPATSAPEPPVVGFLERLCPEKGLDTLVDAFLLLRERFPRLRLRAAGGSTPADEPFLAALRKRLGRVPGAAGTRSWRRVGRGAARCEDAELLPNLAHEEKLDFLRTLSVLSVPARHAEAFGMYVLEALASGVPVVLPRRGAFPELIDATGGGILYNGEGPEALADALGSLLAVPEHARELGERGRRAVLDAFSVEEAAHNTLCVYEKVLSGRSA